MYRAVNRYFNASSSYHISINEKQESILKHSHGLEKFPISQANKEWKNEFGIFLTLTVNPSDMGQVIGKQGTTAKSIRTLMRVAGMKTGARVSVKINEPEKEEQEDIVEE